MFISPTVKTDLSAIELFPIIFSASPAKSVFPIAPDFNILRVASTEKLKPGPSSLSVIWVVNPLTTALNESELSGFVVRGTTLSSGFI